MKRQTTRRLLFCVIAAMAGMTILAIATARPDRTSPVTDHPLAHLTWGLLIAMLGVLTLLNREYALELWWKGDPHRPSERIVLLVVRAACVLLTIAGLTVVLLGVRSLLATF